MRKSLGLVIPIGSSEFITSRHSLKILKRKRSMANNTFGPWATPINAGMNPQLSSFWKRRLKMLAPTSHTSPAIGRRNLLWLCALGALMIVLPTFRTAPAADDGGGAGAAKIDKVTVAVRRVTIQGKSDESHDLVVRINRQEKPLEWRSWGHGSAFEVVIETSDSLGSGKKGHGFVVTMKHDAAKPGGNTFPIALTEENPVVGTFAICREKDLATKDGVLTFADITLKDGKKLPITFSLEPAQINKQSAKSELGENSEKPSPAEKAAAEDNPGKPTENELASPDQNSPFESPRLLYLAWQKDGIRSTGEPIPHTLWDLDGKILDDQLSGEVLKKVGSFSVAWRREGELHPVVLVFQVDGRITHCPVTPTVITADGKKSHGGTARIKPTSGMNVSAAVPKTDALKEWPKTISLEIVYPIDNVTTIKKLTDVPDEPVTIAPGVQWYLDPTRALAREAGRLRRAEGKTAAVLQSSRDLAPLVSYNAQVFLRGNTTPISSVYSTIIEPNGKPHDIDVSEAFDGKNVIERVEFTRQRYAVKRIDNVPVKIDLLPKMEEEQKASPDRNESPKKPGSTPAGEKTSEEQSLDDFHRLYALDAEQVLKRVAPPFSSTRLQYYRSTNPGQAESVPSGPDAMCLRWQDGKLKNWSMTFGSMELCNLQDNLAGIYPQEIEGDAELLKSPVQGDWVVRVGTPKKEILARLEEILNSECKLPVKLSLRTVERKVFVAKGQFHVQPSQNESGEYGPCVKIYGRKYSLDAHGGGSGNLDKFLKFAGSFMNRRVVGEVENPPREGFVWFYHGDYFPTKKEEIEDRDPAAVLKNITEQTGLTFTEETRSVPVLFVERNK
jgi:hypothetical protein